VRTFAAIFTIHGNSPRLMPDLSAAVDIILSTSQNALAIPNQSLGNDHGKKYVWIKNGFDFRKQYVTPGPRNDLETVILSGLVPGEVIRKTAAQAVGH
jgi:multidrug efflux pump subunit AcrA (membrane-fusion protein)